MGFGVSEQRKMFLTWDDADCRDLPEPGKGRPSGEEYKDRRPVGDPALAWSQGFEVEVGGVGTVAATGVVLPRLLADRLRLTTGLARVMARAGFSRCGIAGGRWWMPPARWRPRRRARRMWRR